MKAQKEKTQRINFIQNIKRKNINKQPKPTNHDSWFIFFFSGMFDRNNKSQKQKTAEKRGSEMLIINLPGSSVAKGTRYNSRRYENFIWTLFFSPISNDYWLNQQTSENLQEEVHSAHFTNLLHCLFIFLNYGMEKFVLKIHSKDQTD